MTNDRQLFQGIFLVAVALVFGGGALRFPLGTFDRIGPGFFPLLVSGMLLVIGAATIVRSRYVERATIEFNVKNIAIVSISLCGFALVSEQFKMIAGIVFLVFTASFAGRNYSIVRNIKLAAALLAVAFAFRILLGFNLPLY